MSFDFVFLLSSYLLVFLGLTGLFLTEELSFPYLFLAGASFVVGVFGEMHGGKRFLPGPLANIMMLGVFILTLYSISVLKAPPIQELVHFLLALQTVKLLTPKKERDWLQLYLLSFFSLVASSALSTEISFAVIFVCYLFTAPWVLVLFHLKSAMDAAGKDPNMETRLLSWTLFRLVGGINVVLFFLTLAFFIAFPRLGVSFFGHSWASGSTVTGFSDRLALGEVAEIQKNSAVAMRVSIDRPEILAGRGLYWRGLALDLFDGRKWQKSTSDLAPLRRAGEIYLVGNWGDNTAPPVRQKIFLEPTGSPALFTLNRPVTISGRIHNLFRDPLGNLRAADPFHFQISYEALSYLEASWQEKFPESNFLQLPAIDPRIVSLSRRITEGINEDMKKARALERYLKENYRYSLKDLPVGKDPLAVFLFELRQGNCEYFSSTLAVMLRSLGIPTRVVNGYLGGEWNPYGQYYLIRQSNAHSWVEAYFSDRGWVTLDPTPSIPSRSSASLFSSLNHFVDFLRMRWYRYVINFGFGDQHQLLSALKRPNSWFSAGLRGFSLSELRKEFFTNLGWWIGIGLLLGTLVVGWNWLRGKESARKAYTEGVSQQASERYRRLLALLKRKGFRKEPGETPDEFCQRAKIVAGYVVEEITSLYQQARFSGRKDFTDALRKMDQLLLQLGK